VQEGKEGTGGPGLAVRALKQEGRDPFVNPFSLEHVCLTLGSSC
jgi:hypothetical protein